MAVYFCDRNFLSEFNEFLHAQKTEPGFSQAMFKRKTIYRTFF